MPQDFVRSYSDPIYAGFTRQHPFQLSVGQRVDGQPRKVLRVSYPPSVHVDREAIWHGIIAKGGAPVCHACCVPIGESIECEIPDVINCAYRKGLDMLTDHYADAAVGFNIVSFVPDNEKDYASYTELLRYLSSNDRAWVAKFGDGTNLFLVPPSDFLKKVLKVDGPTRIYGVVFKYAHHTPSCPSLPPESTQPQYIDAPGITSSQAAYDAMTSVGRVSEVNDDQLTQARALLTPELVATLRNMLPSSSVEGTAGASASDVAVAPQSWR